MELIIEIGTSPASFSKLSESVNISEPTLSNRLEEGVNVGLLNQYVDSNENRNLIKYELSDKGYEVFELLEQLEVNQLIEDKLKLENELDSKTTTVISEFKK